MKPATELIITDDGVSRDARAADDADLRDDDFVFENARGGEGLQRGEVDEVPLFALREPDRRAASRRRSRRSKGPRRRWCFSSGQAATATALMALLKAGDEVVCSAAIYGGTLHLLADLLPKFGITPRFVSLESWRSRSR